MKFETFKKPLKVLGSIAATWILPIAVSTSSKYIDSSFSIFTQLLIWLPYLALMNWVFVGTVFESFKWKLKDEKGKFTSQALTYFGFALISGVLLGLIIFQ